jgi:hypothetical protein
MNCSNFLGEEIYRHDTWPNHGSLDEITSASIPYKSPQVLTGF